MIYKPCGNRRADICPGCAETYRRDAFHLLRAGLAGGKGIPESVAAHPVVFATFTAPSFGPVHSRPVRLHACAGKQPLPLQARTLPPPPRRRHLPPRPPPGLLPPAPPGDPASASRCAPTATTTPPTSCGTPPPGNCGGAPSRTSNATSSSSPAAAASPAPAEDQPPRPPVPRQGRRVPGTRRRPLPRPAPPRRHHRDDPDAIIAPPPGITAADLEDAVRQAAATVCFRTRPHPDSPDGQGWLIAWGQRLDVRTVTDRGSATVTGLAVASYLAKYATKGTEATGHASARITPDALGLYANPAGTHTERLIDACWHVGHARPDARQGHLRSLRRWAHMLGFGGHFLTKARRYSVTFTALRQARITYRRHQDTGPDYTPFDRKTTRRRNHAIVVRLSYAGTGWRTFGDALLANTAADQARKRRQAAREELASEYAEAFASEAA